MVDRHIVDEATFRDLAKMYISATFAALMGLLKLRYQILL